MPYFAHLSGRESRRRRAAARDHLEALEVRTMLSGTAASLAASQASVTSIVVLKTSANTAVAGANVTFSATVEDASNDAPIASGKVKFVAEGPKTIVLGDVNVSKQGQASVTTNQLTKFANYQIEAEYTPTDSTVSASASAPITVTVIPQPVDVPTLTTLYPGGSIAETGQYVPLVAAVTNAGTVNVASAGTAEPSKGKVEFFIDSPDPIVLGKVNLSKSGRASLATKMLKDVGSYPIEAEFLPATKFFAASTSAPQTVTITPQTLNAPTATSVQATDTVVETGEPFTLNATVQNASSSLPDGIVKFVTVSPHPVALGETAVSNFGKQVTIATYKLQKVGIYQVEAKYLPNTNRFAESFSTPITVAVTPLIAASFRVTPVVRHSKLNKPASFEVTAIDVHGQPVTNYTGTVVFASPTDSWTTFPPYVYASLHISAPPPQSTGLAIFNPQSYTFTTADHGSQTFAGGVTFGKAGAEDIKVTQANDPKVFGRTTFAIE